MAALTLNQDRSTWSKYRETHRWRRITDFPGMTPPRRVRIYRRGDHYLLDWWDRSLNGHDRQRIDGDLAEAVVAARQIDERLLASNTSGRAKQKVGHDELVDAYLADVQGRTDAGQLATATLATYRSALVHYLAFVAQPEVARRYDRIGRVDRAFARQFAAFLNERRVSGNGRGAPTRRMQSPDKVLDAVRAMYRWASQTDQPRLLTAGFENPFAKPITGRGKGKALASSAPLALTAAMAADLLVYMRRNGNEHDLALFASILLAGMRAAEPAMLFTDNLRDGWLGVGNVPELDYESKGATNKWIPLPAALRALLERTAPAQGLLFRRRQVLDEKQPAPLANKSRDELIERYQQRCRKLKASSAKDRQRLREAILHDAGGTNYDEIARRFQRCVKQMNWPGPVMLKDLRHLFLTALNEAGVPDSYRSYLAGHQPEGKPLDHYTHLPKIESWYQRALEQEFGPVLEVLNEPALPLFDCAA